MGHQHDGEGNLLILHLQQLVPFRQEWPCVLLRKAVIVFLIAKIHRQPCFMACQAADCDFCRFAPGGIIHRQEADFPSVRGCNGTILCIAAQLDPPGGSMCSISIAAPPGVAI